MNKYREPCGECRLQSGEVCDICGASHSSNELLKALEIIIKAIDFGDPVTKSSLPYHRAKLAIAKAKGTYE